MGAGSETGRRLRWGNPSPTMRLPLEHWGFSVGSDGLRLGSVSLLDLASRNGTPLYLFDERRLQANARGALQAVADAGLGADLLYSLKTNPHPTVLDITAASGLGAEVISTRELEAALGAGVGPERIVFNGPGKSDHDLELALDAGVLIQVESASEAGALARIAESRGRTARTGIRVNPDVAENGAADGLRMGRRGSVFGLDPDGAGFREALRALHRSPVVRLVSLSAHIGTGITTVEPFRRLARVLAATRRRLAEDGARIELIDLGGGFAVPSEVRYGQGSFDSLLPPTSAEVPPAEDVATFSNCCSAIAGELGDTGPRCLFEPGRLLVSDAFHLITRVLRIKEEAGTRFAILDAGRIQNALFVGRGFHEIVLVNDPLRAGRRPWTLTGPLCADFDVFATDRPLPDLREGDLVAVLDVGAYNLSAQSTWSFDPAPVVGVDSDSPTPVRED